MFNSGMNKLLNSLKSIAINRSRRLQNVCKVHINSNVIVFQSFKTLFDRVTENTFSPYVTLYLAGRWKTPSTLT